MLLLLHASAILVALTWLLPQSHCYNEDSYDEETFARGWRPNYPKGYKPWYLHTDETNDNLPLYDPRFLISKEIKPHQPYYIHYHHQTPDKLTYYKHNSTYRQTGGGDSRTKIYPAQNGPSPQRVNYSKWIPSIPGIPKGPPIPRPPGVPGVPGTPAVPLARSGLPAVPLAQSGLPAIKFPIHFPFRIPDPWITSALVASQKQYDAYDHYLKYKRRAEAAQNLTKQYKDKAAELEEKCAELKTLKKKVAVYQKLFDRYNELAKKYLEEHQKSKGPADSSSSSSESDSRE